ncbi:MAG: NAD(P)/FAD-dependent oxidoreductase [Promethearchaeota archaeon]
MQKYDVLVVGGGPGGLIAGKIAAENGLNTIIFERGKKSGEKNASGVGLTPKIWRDFPNIMKDMNLPSQRIARSCTAHLCDDKGEIVSEITWSPSKLNDYKEAREFMTVMVYRSQFDHWLSGIAQDSGAELKTSTLIVDVLRDDEGKIIGVIDEKGEKYEGLIIGADGALSIIARKSGIREKFGPMETTLVVNYDFEAPAEKIDEIIGDNALHTWFSPLYPAVSNFFKKDGFHIGLGQWYGKIDKNLVFYLNRCIKSPPVVKLIKRLNAKPRELHAHALPWLQFPHKTYGYNVMLVGDAAGFPCPLEAEGIWHAMYSGRLAALNAKEALDKDDVSENQMKKYEKAWINSELGKEFAAGKELQEFWANIPFSPENMWYLVEIFNDMMNLFTGSMAHIDMSRKFFHSIPLKASKLLPLLRKYILPYMGRVLEEDINEVMTFIPMFEKLMPLMEKMIPKKRRKNKK